MGLNDTLHILWRVKIRQGFLTLYNGVEWSLDVVRELDGTGRLYLSSAVLILGLNPFISLLPHKTCTRLRGTVRLCLTTALVFSPVSSLLFVIKCCVSLYVRYIHLTIHPPTIRTSLHPLVHLSTHPHIYSPILSFTYN